MKILITGAAGFIGSHLSKLLSSNNHKLLGIDNLNEYYDLKLKKSRLLNIQKSNFEFREIDVSNFNKLDQVFKNFMPDIVIHLAAQAGVRYSIEKPYEYINSNLVGFFNILECCKLYECQKLLFASSSSIYGDSKKIKPILKIMGKKLIHCGEGGAGQSTKMCNNLLLAITMKGVGEAFKLADALNLDKQKLYEVVSTSSGSCWAINNYCPVKGIGPNSPADNNFKPGFSSTLMFKDLSLAMDAARNLKIQLNFGTIVLEQFEKLIKEKKGNLDFSVIVNEK